MQRFARSRASAAFAFVILLLLACPHVPAASGGRKAAHPTTNDGVRRARLALDEALAHQRANPSEATALAVEAARADLDRAKGSSAKRQRLGSTQIGERPESGTRLRSKSAAAALAQAVAEVEPNDTPAQATPLSLVGACAVATGSIAIAGDADFYSVQASTGSTLWAYVDSGGPQRSTGTTRDVALTLYGSDGTTIIEEDDNDGSGNGGDSSTETQDAAALAGVALPDAGAFYLRVTAADGVGVVDTYRVLVVLTTGAGAPESEPNDTGPTAGVLGSTDDGDVYTIEVAPGASLLYLSTDGDPERDSDGTDVAIELFGPEAGTMLFTSDPQQSGLTPLYVADSSDQVGSPAPPAEAFSYRAPVEGTYYVRVRSLSQDTGTYALMGAACADPPLPCPPPAIHGRIGEGSADFPAVSGTQTGILRATAFPVRACKYTRGRTSFLDTTGERRYDAYVFENASDAATCVSFTVRPQCDEVPIHAVFYHDSFDPTDLKKNVFQSLLTGVNPLNTITLNFGPRERIVVVLVEQAPGSTCLDYEFAVGGLPGCADAPTDLVITKTGSVDTVTAGQRLGYRIDVFNDGPTSLSDVVVTDTLPDGVSFEFLQQRGGKLLGWQCTSPAQGSTGTITCSVPSLPPGSITRFFVGVIVNADTPIGSTITNTATGTTSTPQLDTSNDSSSATTQVALLTNVGVASLMSIPAPPGSNLTFPIFVFNQGPYPASDVVLTIAMPAGTTFRSLTAPPGWTCATPPLNGTGPITCTIPELPPGYSEAFTLVVRIDRSVPNNSNLFGSATISTSTPETDTINNSAGLIGFVGTPADVALEKTVSPYPVRAGDQLKIRLVVRNFGPNPATGVGVWQSIPPGTTLVRCGASGGGVCVEQEGGVRIDFPNRILVGRFETIEIVLAVDCSVPDGTVLSTYDYVFSTGTVNYIATNDYPFADVPVSNQPITLTCPSSQVVGANAPGGAYVTYPAPTPDPASASVVCTPASGAFFPIGTTEVICQASTTCGDSTSCSFNVEVVAPAFDLCAVDDNTGDYFKVVTQPGPSVGYWEFHVVNGPGPQDDVVYYGVAETIESTATQIRLRDVDNPPQTLTSTFNTNTGLADVKLRVGAGPARTLKDRNYFNSTCP
jgi:uncharacterized repeat protein (TIGR01451 family)